MSFSALKDSMPIASFVNEHGHKRVAFSLGKMDRSWGSTTRVTASVMCALVAALADGERDAARAMMAGLLGLMGRMSDSWAEVSGSITAVSLDNRELKEEAQEVDKLGQELFKQADRFSVVVMVELLGLLPATVWTPYFKVASGVKATFQQELDEQDAVYMSVELAEEQVVKMREFIAAATAFMEEDSEQMAAAIRWQKVAREVFATSIAGGLSGSEAMANTIKAVGFPSAGGFDVKA
jgi:hypothetical protein